MFNFLATTRQLAGVVGRAGVAVASAPSSLLTDLAFYFPGDETSGNLIDVHTNGYDATAVNAPGTGDGRTGSARTFSSASSQRFSIPDNDDISLTADWTLKFDVYFTDLSAVKTIASKWETTGTNSEFILRYSNTQNTIGMVVYDGSSVQILQATALGAPSLNTWYTIVTMYDAAAGVLSLRVDDLEENRLFVDVSVAGGTAFPFLIGSQDLGAASFDGRMQEIAMWRRLLTWEEQAALVNDGNGSTYDNWTIPATLFTKSISNPVIS